MNKYIDSLRLVEKKLRRVDGMFKIVVVGEKGVGKTSLVERYKNNVFKPNSRPTIGVDFSALLLEKNGLRHKVQVWDSTGMETLQSTVSRFLRTADAVVVVYDVTDRNSFISLSEWFRIIHETARADARLYLVGTKCDLEHLKTVFTRDIKHYLIMRKNIVGFPVNVRHFETSALQGNGVDEVFDCILDAFSEKVWGTRVEEKTRLLVEDSPPMPRRCFCC